MKEILFNISSKLVYRKAVWLLFVVSLLTLSNGIAQQNPNNTTYQEVPQLTFLQETIEIGEPLKAQLTFLHETEMDVVFPDSAASYAPFEYLGREIYTTQSNDSMSLDCTVYLLQTFQLDSVQSLKMEVEIFTENQKLKIPSNMDSVGFKPLVDFQPKNDSVVLKEKDHPLFVKTEVNTMLWMIVIGSVLIIAIVLFAIFGKGIVRNLRMGRLKKRHQKFVEGFNEKSMYTKASELELLVGDWKKYLGTLDKKDIPSLTTSEMYEMYEDKEVWETLKEIDAVIYGGVEFKNENKLQELLRLAEDRFHIRLDALKRPEVKKSKKDKGNTTS